MLLSDYRNPNYYIGKLGVVLQAFERQSTRISCYTILCHRKFGYHLCVHCAEVIDKYVGHV